MSANHKPVVFLTFANDQGKYLESLQTERKQLKQIFGSLAEDLQVEIEKKTEVEDLFEGFRDFGQRIILFHYAGHAERNHLLLEDALARDESLADLMKAEGMNQLQLVVLNGCATVSLVDQFLRIGAKAVLATKVGIDDSRATLFSEAFYASLAKGNTLKGAFESARVRLDMAFKDQKDKTAIQIIYRNLGFKDQLDETSFPWGLYLKKGQGDDILYWELADAIDNLLLGLPELPADIGLPASPFKPLLYYTRDDARVFFGRDREIRQLYRLVQSQATSLTLLYGQSGVGKSSLLFAGLVPRLEAEWGKAFYVREDHLSALQQLEDRLGDPEAKVLVIFDQLEELITLRPNQNKQALEEFLKSLDRILSGTSTDRLKVILGFRKEYFAEVEKILDRIGCRYQKSFLEPINRQGIIKVVVGVQSTPELINRYRLSIQPATNGELPLAECMANDILQDQLSNIAPALQILLNKMFEKAKRLDRSNPTLTYQGYRDIKENGLLLQEYVQHDVIQFLLDDEDPKRVAWAHSGLILDLLHYFMTDQETADQHTRAALTERYAHIDQWEGILDYCQQRFLIADFPEDTEGQERFRLSHDALGPIVRQLFDASERPGQRAWRIINAKKNDVLADPEKRRFSQSDIDTIMTGKYGMPNLEVALREKIEKDQQHYYQQRKQRFDLAFDKAIQKIEYPNFEEALDALQIAQVEEHETNSVLEKTKELIYPLAYLQSATKLKEAFRLITSLPDKSADLWKKMQELLHPEQLPTTHLLDEIKTLFEQHEPELLQKMQKRFFPRLVPIPGKEWGGIPLAFEMGAQGDELVSQREGPAHRVVLDPYHLADTPVTFWQYGLYCLATQRRPSRDSGFKRGAHPVINVSWYEAVAYCNWLSQQLGHTMVYDLGTIPIAPNSLHNQINWDTVMNWEEDGFRLPTEAEWEFAASARLVETPSEGKQIKKWRFGNGRDIISPDEVNFDTSGSSNNFSIDRGWMLEIREDRFRGETTPVKSFMQRNNNPFKLHDLSGNVFEWCWDWHFGGLNDETDSYFVECQNKGTVSNPRGFTNGELRVLRGGSWNNHSYGCRSTYRARYNPNVQGDGLGFRIARR